MTALYYSQFYQTMLKTVHVAFLSNYRGSLTGWCIHHWIVRRVCVDAGVVAAVLFHWHTCHWFILPVLEHLFPTHEAESHFVTTIRVWREFDHAIQRDADIRSLFSIQPHKVGVENPKDALVANDENGFSCTLHFLSQRFQTKRNIHVGLSARITIGQLVLLATFKL